MTPERPNALTRRHLLRNGVAGSAMLALGAAAPAYARNASKRGAVLSPFATTASSTPRKGGTLTFARSVAPTQLDPANSIIAGDVYTLDKIFEPLYITSAAGELIPWLATGYTVSSNKKTWTFHLRPGVRFSDGSPLTADDVVFSIKREAANTAGPLSFLDFAIKSITADGTNAGRSSS